MPALTAFKGKKAVLAALNREKTALTAFNGKYSGVNGVEPEK